MAERLWDLEIINEFGEEISFSMKGDTDTEMMRNAYDLLHQIKSLTNSDVEAHLVCLIDEEEK
jgi:hypothetical protein